MSCHCCARTTNELFWVLLQHFLGSIVAHVIWHVRQRIVCAGLVSHDVCSKTHLQQLRKHVCGIANNTNRKPALFSLCFFTSCNCIFKRVCNFVKVTSFNATIYSPCINVYTQCNTIIHRDGKWLCSAHSTKTGSQRDGASESSIELATSYFSKALVCTLQNSLRTDVYP